MIVQALSMILPMNALTGESTVASHNYVKETVLYHLHRIKDELLWPRILVRNAPPPDEVQPNAPDRSS